MSQKGGNHGRTCKDFESKTAFNAVLLTCGDIATISNIIYAWGNVGAAISNNITWDGLATIISNTTGTWGENVCTTVSNNIYRNDIVTTYTCKTTCCWHWLMSITISAIIYVMMFWLMDTGKNLCSLVLKLEVDNFWVFTCRTHSTVYHVHAAFFCSMYQSGTFFTQHIKWKQLQ